MYRVKEGLIGCAIGDSFGVSSKNKNRDYLLENPVLKMTSNIKEGIPTGAWSSNTSLMLVTIDSIEKNGYSINSIADNCINYILKNNYSSVNDSFGLDIQSIEALIKYSNKEAKPIYCGLEDNYSGSSLSMIYPVILYSMVNKKNDLDKSIYEVTRLFHNNELCLCGSYILTNFIINLYNTNDKEKAIKQLKKIDYSMFDNNVLNKYFRLLIGNIEELELEELNTSNNIVDIIENIMWCFMKSNSFKDAIIGAINIGGDTCTIGSITGLLAGIYYGMNSIPKKWISDLLKNDELKNISEEYEKYLRILSYEN